MEFYLRAQPAVEGALFGLVMVWSGGFWRTAGSQQKFQSNLLSLRNDRFEVVSREAQASQHRARQRFTGACRPIRREQQCLVRAL
ncbi:MAG: hypothetical protein AUF67_08955 [Acidobacteria bacterium 13_1_20CM_58_21]|nr:MAG: hypothetical protein AUF67_08955 [Acidobacteria bacterium 13_1_20CM_58_21]